MGVGACANDGSTTAKQAINAAPCTWGGSTCTAGQTCTLTATTKCATPAAPSPATPAPPPTTITQKITFSGTQASYTGTLKTFSEQSYGKAIGIFDTTTTPPAYKTGCSVPSVPSPSRRTSYAVTFTATVASAQASAANTASTATAVAAPTTSTATVSGASTVTTSIMAMAVA